MSKSLQSLFEQLDRNFNIPKFTTEGEVPLDENFADEILDEDNSGNSGGEYLTPNAFVSKESEPEDDSYPVKVQSTERFYRKIEDIYNRTNSIVSVLTEGNYSDFRNDDTKSERQKINGNIIEINRKLREVEQMISHASKLKLETGAGSDIYWKATARSFLKIKEKLNRLSQKIVEIGS